MSSALVTPNAAPSATALVPTAQVLLNDFSLAEDFATRQRIVIAVDGVEKQGKTHFALTAPSPIVYLDFDLGTEGVVEKFKKPYILMGRPYVVRPTMVGGDVQKYATGEWDRFRDTFIGALKNPVVKTPDGRKLMARTVIVDTGTEMWELVRLAELGKLTQVKPHHYTEVNAMVRDLVRLSLDCDVNVIFLHKLKATWKDNSEGKARKTGEYERAGFSEMGFLVQANLTAYRVPRHLRVDPAGQIDPSDLGFRLRVDNSRHQPALDGFELANDQISFATIAQMMIPGSSEEDWQDVA